MPDQRWIEEAEKIVANWDWIESSVLEKAIAQLAQDAFEAGMAERHWTSQQKRVAATKE